MDSRNNLIAADQPETRPSSPSREWATAEVLIPQLSACLALVRPVSMSEDAAAEWLTVAATELAGYLRLSVEAGLSDARQRCTHHGQIVPHVIKYMEASNSWRLGKPLERRLPNQQRALPSPTTQAVIGQATRALTARHPGYVE